MEKKEALGVAKRKGTIKKNKKKFMKKVVEYLKSDSYMFAPLISPPSTDFLASRIVPSACSTTSAGLETKKTKKQRSKSLMKKAEEYLISDNYLYSALCVPQNLASPTGCSDYVKRFTMEMEITKTSVIREEDDEPAVEARKDNEFAQTQTDTSGRNISGQQKFIHKEKVQHMLYRSCRSSSVSAGKPMLNSQLKKVVID